VAWRREGQAVSCGWNNADVFPTSLSIHLQEKKRIEAVKKRQEKELQRIIENEKKMAELQRKLVQVRWTA
jgi:hypothetical protein